MRGNTFKRLISLALCAAMLVAAAVPVFAEEQTVTSSDGSAGGTSSGYNKTTLADLSDQLSLISYSQYLENHAGVSAGTKEIVINAADYDEKATTAKNITKESGVYGLEDEVVLTDDAGKITWSFNVEEEGMYSIKVDYAPYSSRKTNIERIFYINDEVPFSQARYMNFLKTWTFNYVEQEDGTVRFESDRGTLEWQADGNVQADYTLTESAPTSASEALEQARRLCSRWGFQAEQAGWTAEDTVVTLTGSVAGLPVHNRRLTLDFSAGDGSVSLVGLWSFGTPYTTANGISITCSAADALLQFAAESGETGTIESMTAGYRMQTDSSRRIRLTPTWKIDTETCEYLVDCDKKTIIGEEN